MGCFDSVRVRCICGELTDDAQSKAGECWLQEFVINEDMIPPEIAADVHNEVVSCACGKSYQIRAHVNLIAYPWPNT